MGICIGEIIELCLRKGIITEEQVPWFRYGLEKRIYTVIGLIPFVIIAILLTNLATALSFIGAFYALRSRTSGYHAPTLGRCMLISLAAELLFLLVLYPCLTLTCAVIVSAICVVFILIAAPYNHPNMHLSKEEIYALKHSVRRRSIVLLVLICILSYAQLADIAKGLTTGIAMAAGMLCLAYIT